MLSRLDETITVRHHPQPLDSGGVLLAEAHHRAANEVTAALAGMHLARSARDPQASRALLDRAIDRLHAFGECSRLLAAPMPATADAGALIDKLCRALLRSRSGAGPDTVVLSLDSALVPGETARRMALVAHELVTNATKHAFGSPGGRLEIRLVGSRDGLVLSVVDDGPGLGASAASPLPGSGLGGGILRKLVAGMRGSISCDSGTDGTAFYVSVPRADIPTDTAFDD